MKTHWFDLLFVEPPPDGLPGIVALVTVKGGFTPSLQLPVGQDAPICIGHQAVSGREVEMHVEELKAELDEIAKEAKRLDTAYHRRLKGR